MLFIYDGGFVLGGFCPRRCLSQGGFCPGFFCPSGVLSYGGFVLHSFCKGFSFGTRLKFGKKNSFLPNDIILNMSIFKAFCRRHSKCC